MNSLFDGFDLTASNKVVAKNTATKPKQTKKLKQEAQLTNQNLFSGEGMDEFTIELNKPRVETLLNKLNSADESETSAAKMLKSKSLTLEEKLAIIKRKVLEVLGKQRKNVIVIKNKEEFEDYVSKAIEFGRIAIDTETNNSTDPMTCQLMGLCLYYKGGKQAYIPIHHVNPETGEGEVSGKKQRPYGDERGGKIFPAQKQPERDQYAGDVDTDLKAPEPYDTDYFTVKEKSADAAADTG